MIPDNATTREVQAEIVRAKLEKSEKSDRATRADKAEKADKSGKATQAEKDKAASEAELLGNDTGLPQPSVEPVHLDLPFLKPLGQRAPLGQSIDERI